MVDEFSARTTPGGMNRRDFVKTTAAACSLYAAAADNPAPAAGAEDLAKLTISEASRRLHAKEITSSDLTRSCLDCIKTYNPKVNAYITIMHEEALARAAQLDTEARAGKFRSALHGIPIALKDNIDTAGTRTTGGSAVFDERFPDADAEVVRRLRDAGAVIIGKTNLQEFAMGGTSVSTYFLPVRNPWALDRISAGSSGGSAAAVYRGHDHGGARYRHRRLGAHARCLLQHRRAQADVWSCVDPGNHPAYLLARSLRSDDQNRRRCSHPVECYSGIRQTGCSQRGAPRGRLCRGSQAAYIGFAIGDSARSVFRSSR